MTEMPDRVPEEDEIAPRIEGDAPTQPVRPQGPELGRTVTGYMVGPNGFPEITPEKATFIRTVDPDGEALVEKANPNK